MDSPEGIFGLFAGSSVALALLGWVLKNVAGWAFRKTTAKISTAIHTVIVEAIKPELQSIRDAITGARTHMAEREKDVDAQFHKGSERMAGIEGMLKGHIDTTNRIATAVTPDTNEEEDDLPTSFPGPNLLGDTDDENDSSVRHAVRDMDREARAD